MKVLLNSNHTSETLDMYEFKVVFNNVKPEEVILFIQNFNITLEASGILVADVRI